MKIKFTHCVVLIFLLFSCQQNNGPCEYDIAEFEAKVVSLEPYQSETGKQLFHIVLKFNSNELSKQNQFLEDWLPRIKGKTDSTFIQRNQIKPGHVYSGMVSELKSGNCEPVYVSFNHYFKTE